MNAGDFFRADAGLTYLNLVAPTLPAALYAAAFTDSVDQAGVGTEVADPASNTINYSRQLLPVSAWTSNGTGGYSLTVPLVFPQAIGGPWGTVVSIAFTSAQVGALAGLVHVFGDVDTPKPIGEFDTLILSSGINFILQIT